MTGIYKITNLITNEIYIGSSKNIEQRWRTHKSLSTWKQKSNSKLYKAFQIYGLENFEFSVVEECEKENLHQREEFYIQSLNPEYNQVRAYNTSEEKKNYKKNYEKNYQKTSETYKNYHKNYQKTYRSQLCNFQGETLTLNALCARFCKQGIPHPAIEAKKYLVS